MVEIKVRLDNDDHYKGGNTKEYIVVHDTGNRTDSDEGNANYFCTGKRNASAHYFVDDDSITQVVLDDDCSFHCGDGNGKYGITNKNSIGIELCRVNDNTTETTKNNAIDLIRMLMNKYNIPIEKVVRHYDASRKICPSSMSANNWAKWNEFKARLSQQSEPNKWMQNSIGWWYRHSDGSYTTLGWELISGEWYYFDEKGYMKSQTFINHKGQKYYVKENGMMVKGWLYITDSWYYFDTTNGDMKASHWLYYNSKWYYLKDNGKMACGEDIYDITRNKWYSMDASGVLI